MSFLTNAPGLEVTTKDPRQTSARTHFIVRALRKIHAHLCLVSVQGAPTSVSGNQSPTNPRLERTWSQRKFHIRTLK